MFTTITASLQEWSDKTDSRQKLQHAYAAAAMLLVLCAGILGLINYDLGQRLLLAAFVCAAAFVFNAVAWALLYSFVLMRIPKKQRAAAKSTTRKK